MITVLLIMSFAFMVEACFGFGGGLIAVPLLSMYMDPKDAVVFMLFFQCLKAYLLIPAWKNISWPSFQLLPIGLLIGAFIGIQLLNTLPADGLRLLLGIYLIFYVASNYVTLSALKKWAFNRKTTSAIAGFSGGIISGVTGMGGPAIVAYLKNQGLNKDQLRASILLILSLLNWARLGLDAENAYHSIASAPYLIPCLMSFAVFTVLGSHIPKLLSEATFKHSINGLLLISGIILLIKSF